MGVPGNADLLLLKTAAAAGGYQVSRSLRFNSADSAYLSRTPASAGNRKTWTWSSWIKIAKTTGNMPLLNRYVDTGNYSIIDINNAQLRVININGGGIEKGKTTAQVFRDVSAWYHIVVSVDNNTSTLNIYVNGTQVTQFTDNNTVTADWYFNDTNSHNIGREQYSSSLTYFDGYMADIWFLDGIAATPSDFAETDATTGQWIPKTYSGSKGSNGFHLEFADNSAATAAALGKDTSGNGNNWTPNNLSVTAGAGNDSLVDVPTNGAQTDTGVGGEVRGNYCTWNPLKPPGGTTTFANGNLETTFAYSTTYPIPMGTLGVSSGKWYWEITPTSGASGSVTCIGLATGAVTPSSSGALGYTSTGWSYIDDGKKYNNNSLTSYGASYTNNDVIGVALDADNGTLIFYKNGSSQGTAYTGLTSGPYFPALSSASNAITVVANFGQRAFAYTAPSGYKALCTANLPAPVIAKPSESAFDVKLWTGTGSNQTITTSFSPDFVWAKPRSAAASHGLYDTVRGNNLRLSSNQTASEGTVYLQMGSTGFTVEGSTSYGDSGVTYVGWVWDAGSSTVTNTQGSITSSVRANTSAGFSVLTATTPTSGSSFSVGHGLGVAPAFAIFKDRGYANSWGIYHKSITTTTGGELLFTTAAAQNYGWFPSAPTSTTFTLSVGGWGTGASIVGYLWTPVAGYSSFGSYTGNGSTDGPFVYTGFRPRWILIKRTDTSGNNWVLHDTARDTYNAATKQLLPSEAGAETDTSVTSRDILSNGFKLRGSNDSVNGSSATYIYAAFAESPFQYARAR